MSLGTMVWYPENLSTQALFKAQKSGPRNKIQQHLIISIHEMLTIVIFVDLQFADDAYLIFGAARRTRWTKSPYTNPKYTPWAHISP